MGTYIKILTRKILILYYNFENLDVLELQIRNFIA